MMPQLGVMANIENKEIAEQSKVAALEVFEKDCLIRLGTCIAPVGKLNETDRMLNVSLEFENGEKKNVDIRFGDLIRIKVGYENVRATLTPAKGVDVGAGLSQQINTTIQGGQVGIIIDGRGRPLHINTSSSKRISDLKKWSNALDEYPELSK